VTACETFGSHGGWFADGGVDGGSVVVHAEPFGPFGLSAEVQGSELDVVVVDAPCARGSEPAATKSQITTARCTVFETTELLKRTRMRQPCPFGLGEVKNVN